MQQHHAEMLAVALAAQKHKPSIAERDFYARREVPKPIGRDKDTLRNAGPGRSLMVPHLLRSGIFALSAKTAHAQRAVPKYDDVSDVTQGASVEYKGERLRQFDMRVALGVLHLAGGMHCEKANMKFHVNDFARLIGKEKVSTDTVEAIRDSLANLRSATFVVRNFAKDKGVAFGLIDSVEWDRRECTVTLSPSAHRAVDALGFTLLPLDVRNRLTDGVQTALADIFYSTSANSFDLGALAAIFGRDPYQFGQEVREALPVLVAAGVLTGWSKTRGRVHVVRASKF
jgi:hypothetical protein